MRCSSAVLAVFICALCGARSVVAAEVAARSRADAVTVFLSGAEVTRTAKVRIDKGEHTIVFDDIPASAVAGSIRVEGKATGKLDIGSVDTQRKLLSRAEGQAAGIERKKLEDEAEALRDQKDVIQTQIQAAETQRALIANLVQLPLRPAPAGSTNAGEDWSRILSIIPQVSVESGKLLLDAQIKARDLDRKLEDIDKKLGALAPAKTEQTEVKVNVDAGSPLEADLTVRYQIADAQWVPIYDARLFTGTKTTPPTLSLTRRAAVSQRSGETWENVALQLSTARPSEGASAPMIDTQTVGFEPEFKPPVPVPMAAAPATANLKLGRDAVEGVGDADVTSQDALEQKIPIQEQQAILTSAPLDATYAAGKATIDGTGETKRVVLSTEEIEPKIAIRTVPRMDANAFIYAKLKLAKGSPLLPGKAYLFRDGTFVGTGDLPLLPAGGEHALGFGIDDLVKVKFAVIEEKRGETGIISTSRIDNRSFRVTVKNLHERAVDLEVLDRIPVSQNQDIKVEYTGKSTPTKQNTEDKRGVLSFESPIEADEEKVLEYGYRVAWPAAKSIMYGP